MPKIDEQGVYFSHEEYQKLSNSHMGMSEETKNEFKHITELFTVIFDDFKEILNEIKEDMKEGKKDWKETNGKVKKLQLWKSSIIGGASVLIFFIGVFIYIYNLNNTYLKERLEVLENKLSRYDQIIIKE